MSSSHLVKSPTDLFFLIKSLQSVPLMSACQNNFFTTSTPASPSLNHSCLGIKCSLPYLTFWILTCPLKSAVPFCLLGCTGFWTLGSSETHGQLALGILPSVTEVCLARPGGLGIAMFSQGTNIVPTSFLGFLLSENRLNL